MNVYRILGASLMTGFLYAMWRVRNGDVDITDIPHPDSGGTVAGVVCVFFAVIILLFLWR